MLDEAVTKDDVRDAFRRAYPCAEFNARRNGGLVYGTEGSFYGLVETEACRALQDAHDSPFTGSASHRSGSVAGGATPPLMMREHIASAVIEARRRTCDELRREKESLDHVRHSLSAFRTPHARS